MTTLRIRLAAPPSPETTCAWGLFDAAEHCLRTGVDRPADWPSADRREIVVAASQLRIASIALPPLSPSRVPGAAGFALEDQLAGDPSIHHVAASAQARDGSVRAAIIARSMLMAIANAVGEVDRIVAEPDLAHPSSGWRWCASETEDTGFVCRSDGSAFPVDAPGRGGDLPAELALAIDQAKREGAPAEAIHVDAPCEESDLSRWQAETGIRFVQGTPWRWLSAKPEALAEAIDLRPRDTSVDAAETRERRGRAFATALWLVAAALAVHVVASIGDWLSLRIDRWRASREWTTLALSAGVAPDAAATPASARLAIAQRHSELTHARGLPAPDDALPLLARAAPAFASLPTGTVKSIVYADGHWTFDLAHADPALVGNLDVMMRGAGVPALIASSATGTRLRFGGP